VRNGIYTIEINIDIAVVESNGKNFSSYTINVVDIIPMGTIAISMGLEFSWCRKMGGVSGHTQSMWLI